MERSPPSQITPRTVEQLRRWIARKEPHMKLEIRDDGRVVLGWAGPVLDIPTGSGTVLGCDS